MKDELNILVIIPARGGSKGIPIKNLRGLNGKPLIYYAINIALESKFKPDVYVSSDDDEILNISKKIGAQIHKRNKSISDDKSTLDIVIYDAFIKISKLKNKKYQYVVTLQPTSPLLKTESLDCAIKRMIDKKDIETIISAIDDTHLTWRKAGGSYIPNYKERLNRQFLTSVYKETGGFFITRADIVTKESRIGKNVDLYLLSEKESVDIDTYEDWNICEYYLKQKNILFVLTGYNEVGLGHIYRALQISNDILEHNISFLVDKKSSLGYEVIKSKNYEVNIQKEDNIIEDIKKINPQVIINDILDTSKDYMLSIKNIVSKIINFEDLGEGSKYAGIVFNALYPDDYRESVYSGLKYFIARDEFLLSNNKKISKNIKNVLITFGGTDPNNLTYKVLNAIYGYCINEKIDIYVIVGLGYKNIKTISEFKNIKIIRNVNNMSDYMLKADIIFSSAGRTVYEIACIGTPSIILTQNKRENTHLFGRNVNGFVNLGLGNEIQESNILSEFKNLRLDFEKRKKYSKIMLSKNVKQGRQNVIKIIKEYINS